MQSARFSKPTGRSRKARRRRRADARLMQMHIADYLELDAAPGRTIPIGKRREFLPTAACVDRQEAGTKSDVIYRFGPTQPQQQGGRPVSRHAARAGTQARADRAAHSVPRGLTFGRFLYGCIVGGAAASVLLVVFKAIL